MRDYFLKAGWIRAAWMTALFWGIGLGIVLVFRWWARLGAAVQLGR